MRIIVWIALFTTTLSMLACTMGEPVYAPVLDATIESFPPAGTYRVRADDTLYSIAWRYGLDYRYLAKMNNITKPYHIEPRQLIYLRRAQKQKARHLLTGLSKPQRSIVRTPSEKEPTAVITSWLWPARGKVIGTFSESNRGINIAAHLGAPVLATASGRVVYSGNGLRAYGNLIIIKHNSEYLSAYAHNKTILVKEDEWVNAGQEIAEMGDTGTRQVMLHFEIRYGGKPMNPLIYLTKR